ncbi:MAG TPA: hypothetical protein PKN13_01200 [Accumulibacter sp.]|nr:hypothetical protein [Accumulibacter sp.]HMW19123.1 hypothetical protein [Accumulibacter sp.]HMX23355.1 hypothetical protein [Accumulibacter sp.]HMY07593.1 hypothetical protein [Accumulibacter sp.]HNC18921.1 hypothetical protein [Accumulibacter sp.]
MTAHVRLCQLVTIFSQALGTSQGLSNDTGDQEKDIHGRHPVTEEYVSLDQAK